MQNFVHFTLIFHVFVKYIYHYKLEASAGEFNILTILARLWLSATAPSVNLQSNNQYSQISKIV